MRYVFSGLHAIAQVPRPIAHSHAQRVHETLDRINRNDTANCTSAPGGKERIEMGVALVKRLHRSSSDAMQDTAGFGRGLHEQCACCGGCMRIGPRLVLRDHSRRPYHTHNHRAPGCQRLQARGRDCGLAARPLHVHLAGQGAERRADASSGRRGASAS